MSAADDLIERLVAHKTVGGAPREELAWLVSHGTLRLLAPGDTLSTKGTPVTGLFIVLTGHVAIYLDRGAGRHKVMEWRAGDVAGVLPYSRLVSPPGDSVAQEPTEILAIPRGDLGAMIRDCYELTSLLVHKMLDRSRVFVSSGLQDEKMLSLGKLSAGLAHELNNPVSAIGRSAALLAERLDETEAATRAMSGAQLTDAQLDAVDALRAACLPAQGAARTPAPVGQDDAHRDDAHRDDAGLRQPIVLTPIQRARREDAIADWLSAHDVDADLAGPLAESAVTIDALDRIASIAGAAPLAPVLRSVAASCSVREIASEIHDAARRISGLVAAIKGFTHMDQAVVAEPVDLTSGLADTVAVLNAKARLKSIAVTVHVEPGLPRVRGFVGELNQIWANLIDNALDAVPDTGRVDVTAHHDRHHGRQRVIVSIIDNGPGIPDDVRVRMFDPFFTTKPVGQGTGLGLDIVRRLVNHNDAEIDVETAPGRTTFRVILPVADPEPVG